MKTLADLNKILFEELEHLSDHNKQGDELKAEIERAKSISEVATQIIDNASLSLKAMALSNGVNLPEMIGYDKKNEI